PGRRARGRPLQPPRRKYAPGARASARDDGRTGVLTHARDTHPPRRTVVVGSRGFVGASVVGRLQDLGWEVEPVSSAEVDLTVNDAGERLASRLRPDDALVFVSALTPDRGRDAATLEQNIRM